MFIAVVTVQHCQYVLSLKIKSDKFKFDQNPLVNLPISGIMPESVGLEFELSHRPARDVFDCCRTEREDAGC